MREIGIKQLMANLSKELKDLPFKITKNNKTIATVLAGEIIEQEKNSITHPIASKKETEDAIKGSVTTSASTFKKINKKKHNEDKQGGVGGFCQKHKGSMYLTCRCKPKISDKKSGDN